jgi:predicted nucleotide-binding protein (sugar kinase/HSP70/actin superfamily)
MAKKVKSADFDPKRSAFFMASGSGPCRFGQYNRFHRLVLDELGFSEVPIFAPDQDENIYGELGQVGNGFSRLAWSGMVAVDLLQKRLRTVRPYEIHRGETEKVYRHYLERVCEEIRRGNKLSPLLREANEKFSGIEVTAQKKPIVGIVGEIYIRSNRFSNENLIGNLEQLGCEVWLPPISEWIFYTNYTSKRRNFRIGNYQGYLSTLFTSEMQRVEEHRLTRSFGDSSRRLREPRTEEIVRKASPYVHPSFEGEAILSVGKAIDFSSKGAGGIINTMPFTCMPGTVVSAVLKRCREVHHNIPLLNIAYDGQKESNTKTRLEAFVYQVNHYRERMNGPEV